MAYLNNIIIYFNIKEKYKKYIEWVLKKLYKKIYQLQLKSASFILGKLIL